MSMLGIQVPNNYMIELIDLFMVHTTVHDANTVVNRKLDGVEPHQLDAPKLREPMAENIECIHRFNQ